MIKSIDHIVLTTRDLDKCIAFYTKVLGMQLENYGEGRIALRFGEQKFNVHPPGFEASITARTAKRSSSGAGPPSQAIPEGRWTRCTRGAVDSAVTRLAQIPRFDLTRRAGR